MNRFTVQNAAAHRLDEIYRSTRVNCGKAQAERYIHELFERFDAIAERRFLWRPVPADFGVEGHVCRYERHLIHWKVLGYGDVGMVTLLRERMHQIERFKDDFGN